MKYEIRNTAKRPVSILCNTGETRHLPPNYTSEFLEAEIANNPTVSKLEKRGLIRCEPPIELKTANKGNKKTVVRKAKPKTKKTVVTKSLPKAKKTSKQT